MSERITAEGGWFEPPRWTRERPTEPGWYWVRGYVYCGNKTEIYEIVRRRDGRLWIDERNADEYDPDPNTGYQALDHRFLDDCEWCGPLVPPA